MEPATQHTYLLKPGLWEMAGIYYDKNDHPFPQKGTILVTHEPGLWTVETKLTITTEITQETSSRYEITPPAPGATFMEWKSEAGGPEPIYGLYVMVGDAIMSPWQSKSGQFWGQETFIKTGEGDYQTRGFAFLGQERVSAWSMRLAPEA